MCKMNLKYFPMDTQTCSLELESYGYTKKELDYYWNNNEANLMEFYQNMSLPNFKITGYYQEKQDGESVRKY